jgi:hypothetical protein
MSQLYIGGGEVELECTGELTACLAANVVKFTGGTMFAQTRTSVFVNGVLEINKFNLTVEYGGQSSSENISGAPVLHFGSIAFVDELSPREYHFAIGKRTIIMDTRWTHSLMVNLDAPGDYQVSFSIPNSEVSGWVCWGPQNSKLFPVGNGEQFYTFVRLCDYPQIMATTARRRTISRSSTPQSTDGREEVKSELSTGVVVALSVGAALFVATVVLLVILAKCRDRCDAVSGNAMDVVPVNTLTSSTSQYSEGLLYGPSGPSLDHFR